MPARTLPNLGLRAFYDLGEDGWKDNMDQDLLKLSVLTQGVALDKLAGELVSPVAGDIIILDEDHPTNPNNVAVYDNGAWVYYAPVEGWKLYNQAQDLFEVFDGTLWSALSTGGISTLNYDFGFVFESTPSASSTVGRVRIGRNITIPADMVGSSGGVQTNPTAAFNIDVQDDGVSIGTVSVDTTGAVTFTTTGNVAQNVAAGSEITFVAPGTADATVGGMSAVLLATVD